jgi:serine/threonine protein kinase
MRVKIIQCGPQANESERKAIEFLRQRLQSEAGDVEWILLTNLAFSLTHRLQSDEIDIVAVGPPGVRVVEVKHWSSDWVRSNALEVERESDIVTNKARKIGTTLRRHLSGLPHVAGAFLLTQEPSRLKRLPAEPVRGVKLYGLDGWKEALGIHEPDALSFHDVRRLSQFLEPRSRVAIDGLLRLMAGYVNLELQSHREERFHHVYKGSHPARRDRVVLHLYDLTALDDRNLEAKARREFETLHRLQLYPWAPRILDSFQDAPGYSGEMFFFTVVDPAAPTLAARAEDPTWTPTSRIEFTRNTVRAVSEMHRATSDGQPLVHRNLSPQTILVRHDNSPIITGFDRTKIPADISVASVGAVAGADDTVIPPEVRSQGLAAADCRSDVFSLAASLSVLFREATDELSRRVSGSLQEGMREAPGERSRLEDLQNALTAVLGESPPRPAAPAARYWAEGQIIAFHERDYRLVNRLGAGGVGAAYKVVEVDRATKEDLGTYVAKVAHDGGLGQRILRAYSLTRSHLGRHPGLSTIFEVARQWQENAPVALMTWVEGSPLAEFIGLLPLLAEDLEDASAESLASRWLRGVCASLEVLHRNGLVHGDISPRNMIVSGDEIVLTDYDFVTRLGEPVSSPGTVLYCPLSDEGERNASRSDDIYALAASFFHVLFDREPFRHGGDLDKRRGLNWEGITRSEYARLAEFFDRATHPDAQQRYACVADAIACLEQGARAVRSEHDVENVPPGVATTPTQPSPQTLELREERIDWLRSLLQSYPGSRWGNKE